MSVDDELMPCGTPASLSLITTSAGVRTLLLYPAYVNSSGLVIVDAHAWCLEHGWVSLPVGQYERLRKFVRRIRPVSAWPDGRPAHLADSDPFPCTRCGTGVNRVARHLCAARIKNIPT